MAKRISVDKTLFIVTLLLVFVGLVMVFSASAVMAQERYGSPYTFVLKQMLWAVAGIAAMLGVMNLDYRRYKHPAIIFSLLGITTVLLALVLGVKLLADQTVWFNLALLPMQDLLSLASWLGGFVSREIIWRDDGRLSLNNNDLWLWVPAFAGTTVVMTHVA